MENKLISQFLQIGIFYLRITNIKRDNNFFLVRSIKLVFQSFQSVIQDGQVL